MYFYYFPDFILLLCLFRVLSCVFLACVCKLQLCLCVKFTVVITGAVVKGLQLGLAIERLDFCLRHHDPAKKNKKKLHNSGSPRRIEQLVCWSFPSCMNCLNMMTVLLISFQVYSEKGGFTTFGPTSLDCTGVCYNIQSNSILFMVSTFRQSQRTHSNLFISYVERALRTLRDIMQQETPNSKSKL